MDPLHVEPLDRHRSALHECAHVLVSRHYGVKAAAAIWRNRTDNPGEEKTWLGRTYFQGRHSTPRRSRRVAIAGMLAEFMEDATLTEWDLEDCLSGSFWCADGWSDSDVSMAQGWTSADFRAVHALLRRKWAVLQRDVARLLEEFPADSNSAAAAS